MDALPIRLTTGGDVCPVDLTPSLALDFDQCDQSLVLIVAVHNVGTVDDVPAGVDVTGPRAGAQGRLGAEFEAS